MVLKNLLRRKGRTILTVFAISLGVASIIALGSLADGIGAGYSAMFTGSAADLVLTEEDTMDLSYNSVDEDIGNMLLDMPEVSQVSGMLQGIISSEDVLYTFVFCYPMDSFVLDRFKIVDGHALNSPEASHARGKPIIVGKAMADVLKVKTGDMLKLSAGSAFRIIGIYETGNAFEDSGTVINLSDGQQTLGKQHKVSLFYIRLKDSSFRDRLAKKAKRLWPDLILTDTKELANQQMMDDMLNIFMWAIAGMAIIIGGVGMMNAQLMSVIERTREIGVLRAIGWSSRRVLFLILGESIFVCLAGGILGTLWGWLLMALFSKSQAFLWMGASAIQIKPALLIEAFATVFILGLVGGLYPAWRASRLQPVEALSYEGGSGGSKARRLPFGGMAIQSLWQRTARTLLTLFAIGLTIGTIMLMQSWIRGFANEMGSMSEDAEIMISQAEVADTSLSALDQRMGDKIASWSEVQSVNGAIFTVVMLPEYGSFFFLQGHAPRSFSLRHFHITEGEILTNSHQIIIGRTIADGLNKNVGDSLELSNTRFRIVGIYQTGIGWEDQGGVITLRDAQNFVGRPHKVTMYMVKLKDPSNTDEIITRINEQFPEAHAALSGNWANELPDLKATNVMMDAISILAILVGGLGVMNTMLMAVLERTREIGVLRALGWRRRSVLFMILKETLLLGVGGAVLGIIIAFGFAVFLNFITNNYLSNEWSPDIFLRAIIVALLLGLFGGIYPAYRATCLQPVEALRYE